MAKPKKITKTLFEMDWTKSFPERAREHPNFPYAMIMERLRENSDHQKEFGGGEGYIFPDAHLAGSYLEYGSRISFYGPLKARVPGYQVFDYERIHGNLPAFWIEEDGVKFTSCKARGILLFDRFGVSGMNVKKLWSSPEFKKLNLLIAIVHGIPRQFACRVLHRLTQQFKVPVYYLSDNDTWGYFNFSVLKRGRVPPHMSQPQLAISGARYLGLFTGEAERLGIRNAVQREWKPHYTLRLNALRNYPCFQSKKWQREFVRFGAQTYTCDIWSVIATMGVTRFVEDYLKPKIAAKDWLE